MMDPTMMALLLEQYTHGHEANGQGRPAEARAQHYPQVANQSSTKESRTGVQSSGWEAALEEEAEEGQPATYQSTGFTVPERGAARRFPAFGEMRNFARERGARDDSMIAPRSSAWEDEANLGRLDTMAHLAGRDLAEAVLQASPEQRELITEGEARLEAQLREEEERGQPVPLSRQRMMYAQNVEDLHQQGLIDPEIGQRNREYMQLLETRDRSAIDMGLKHGYGPPVGADPAQVEESAFHPRRGPVSAPPTAENAGAIKSVTIEKWGEGKASSTWGALRAAGWTDREILENKLVDRVGQMNNLQDPARVQPGQVLKVPAKPDPSAPQPQTAALYEADGGPAHRTPSWEQPRPAPTRPTTGNQPAARTQPSEPTQPAPPATGSQPATPAQPAPPATGSQPASPTQPATPAGPAQPERPPERPYDPSRDATALYESMHGGLMGLGTDEDKLFRALEGKTPEQIQAIRAHYRDHYDKDLDRDLTGELGGRQLSRAQELMRGNQAGADADRLNEAMKGGILGIGTNETAIFETLEGKDPAQRAAILEEYRQRNGVDLREHLRGELSGAQLDRANALLDGNQARADAAAMRHAMKGGFLGMGTDEDALYRALDGKDESQRQAILQEYSQTYEGADLRKDLAGELSGAELDRANALLEGDRAGAEAAALNHAMKGGLFGLGTDTDTINRTFEGKSEQERQAIVAAYGRYGSLDAHFREEMGGNDLEKAQKLVADGRLSDVDRLRYAMEGAGTDEDEIKAVLAGKSREEIDALRTEYRTATSRDLDVDLESDLSGRDLFDAKMDLRGRPESAEEAVQRQNERWEYERSGWGNTISNLFVDTFSEQGKQLDRTTARINDQFERVEQLRSEGRLAEAQAAEQRLSQLVDYGNDDISTYREAKDSAANAAGTVAATAASVAVVVGTAGTATPLVVAGLAATAGAGAKVLTSGAIQGQGYGWEAAVSDAGTGAVDGLATAVGAKAGQVAAQSVGRVMATRAEASLATRVATSGANLVDDGARAGTTATTGTTRTFGQRVAMGATEGAVDGTVGGAAGGAGHTALQDGTWDEGVLSGLGRVAEGTAIGAGTGLAVGGVVGGSLPVAGSALSKTREAAGEATAWTRARVNDAGDALRTLRGRGDDAVPTPPADNPAPPAQPGVLGRLKEAGQNFYDYGMSGGYLGRRLKGAGDNVADDAAPVAPKADEPTPATPRADEPTPAAPKADEPTPVAPKADEPTPVAPKADEPTPATPRADQPTPVAPKADDIAPGNGVGRVSDEELFEVVHRAPQDFQASIKAEMGRLQAAGQLTPDAPARVIMGEANTRMTNLEAEILTPLGPGTREQNQAVARVLGQPELGEKDGLVQTVINARAKQAQETLRAQGQDISAFGAYRQEALGTFNDMDQAGIALTPDQQALRARIQQYDDYESIFGAARGNLAGRADDVVPTPAPRPDAPPPPDAPAPPAAPQNLVGRLKQAGQNFYDYGMSGGYLGRRLKGAGDDVTPPVAPRADAPTPAPKPDAPPAPRPDAPENPSPLRRFYDYGMNGGLLGRNTDLGAMGGNLLNRGKQMLDDMTGGAGRNVDNLGDDLAPTPARPDAPSPGTGADAQVALRRRVEQFPDQQMLARFRQETSFNQLEPQQQHTLLELAARHKPEQPQGMLARLFGAGDQRTSAMEGHLHTLLRDGRLTNTDIHGVTLLDNLNQLDQQPMYHRSLQNRALSEEVAATVANPAAVIKQGNRGTCSATSVQYIHATKNPSDYARVMRELTGQGEATLASGQKMVFNRTALGPDNSGRRTADRVYQTSAMNHASGRYDNWIANPEGGQGGHVKPDGSFDYDGLTHKQANQLMRDIMGDRYETVGYHSVSSHGPGDSPAMRAQFREKLQGLREQGEPMHVALTWGEEGHAGHAVAVESMDDQWVYIRNPHGHEARANFDGTALKRENVGPVADGRQRVAHDEFFARLRAYQSRPTTARESDFLRITDIYEFKPQVGDDLGSPEAVDRLRGRFPQLQVEHLDDEARVEFFRGFEKRLFRAGREASPIGEGKYHEALADLDNYMKQFGYPDGDFSRRILT